MKVFFIRHGLTNGNREKRYIGITEEELLPEGVKMLQSCTYPIVDEVYVSPRIRCIKTAQIIYPAKQVKVVDELQECNFGQFENKNYIELSGNNDYQKWIDSGGSIAFPNGESRVEFQARCIRGFHSVMKEAIKNDSSSIAFVVHGGTIMSILDAYSLPHRDYYEWQVGNGCGFETEIDLQQWMNGYYKIEIKENIFYY